MFEINQMRLWAHDGKPRYVILRRLIFNKEAYQKSSNAVELTAVLRTC